MNVALDVRKDVNALDRLLCAVRRAGGGRRGERWVGGWAVYIICVCM